MTEVTVLVATRFSVASSSGAEVADQTEYASEKLAYGNSTKT